MFRIFVVLFMFLVCNDIFSRQICREDDGLLYNIEDSMKGTRNRPPGVDVGIQKSDEENKVTYNNREYGYRVNVDGKRILQFKYSKSKQDFELAFISGEHEYFYELKSGNFIH